MIDPHRSLSHVLPALALAVIVLGAYVRLSDAGLGCPDWPGCYGHLMVPAAAHAAHNTSQIRPLEPGKAWREMVHRYLASTLGFGILLLAVAASRDRAAGPVLWLVPLVVLQGVLGMWTVTLLLKPLVVSAHLLGGLATLSLLWWHLLTVRAPPAPIAVPANLAVAARFTLAVLMIQIFLGGWTSSNYSALACTDFPTCQGQWWPQTDFHNGFTLWRGLGINYEFGVLETPARTAIHLAHRCGALLTTVLVATTVVLAWRARQWPLRQLASCILLALLLQISLGIVNVVGGLPLPVAVAHNAVAAILLQTLVTLVYFTRRI